MTHNKLVANGIATRSTLVKSERDLTHNLEE